MQTARPSAMPRAMLARASPIVVVSPLRSEEHTSELQSRQYLVCRLLLEKNNTDVVYVSSHEQAKASQHFLPHAKRNPRTVPHPRSHPGVFVPFAHLRQLHLLSVHPCPHA